MLKFFQAANLLKRNMQEAHPWDFFPEASELDAVRKLPKQRRMDWLTKADTQWNVYSPVRGLSPVRVDRDNPPTGLRGFVGDYDMALDVPQAVNYCNQVKLEFQPNFIEVSLSRRLRLVWVFEREILCPNKKFADGFLRIFAEKIKASSILAGFDKKSTSSEMVWTNGGEWHDFKQEPVSSKLLFGFACDAGQKMEKARADIPLELVAKEVEARFPNKWKGPFAADNLGVRFWDAAADCSTGCQVKPDGMLCFTGNEPFKTWASIFGGNWTNEQRALNLGEAASEIYFDGRNYWRLLNGLWRREDRADVALALKGRGLSPNAPKGETVSDVERALIHIQTVNRVGGAAPLINQPPGVIEFERDRILNINTIRALEPFPDRPCAPEDFPWIDRILNLFAHPELHPREHFIAWLSRFYGAVCHHERKMGQAVFICGPRENGKTLLCVRIVKPLVGDKMANPYPFFMGETPFNSELFESALLAINDEEAPQTIAQQQRFLAKIKAFCVNSQHAFHPKFCNRVTVEWVGRIFATLNNDPKSTGMIPEKNSNTEDRLMFYGTVQPGFEWPDSAELEAHLRRELPYFGRYLLDYRAPDWLRIGGRMGVKSYFDPDVLELSQQQDGSYRLYEIIQDWVTEADSAFWTGKQKVWEGSPVAFEKVMDVAGKLDQLRDIKSRGGLDRALATLARLPDTGVEDLSHEYHGRHFRITRSKIKTGRKSIQ